MKNGNVWERSVYAVLMGILTILLCLVLADGLIGMDAWYFRGRNLVILPGRIVFWISIIGLPVVFSKWTRPAYTLINVPMYYFLYFPIKTALDNVDLYWHEELRPFFLSDAGLLPAKLNALMIAVLFFGIEFVVLAVSCWIRRKKKHIMDD